MEMLSLKSVSKSFGSRNIIREVSFSVKENSIFGFVGENGAGKTTTMRMILGLLKADAGEILVNGEKVTFGQNKTNRFIGYLPDVPEFYDFMTPLEYLYLCGKVTGMEKSQCQAKSEELLALVGLSGENKRIHGFSRGMKQRLGIAQALLHSPKLLICDEPTSALDPAGRKEILEILQEVKRHTTVLFSTHILSDVERICDEVAFLHQGCVAFSGTMEEVRGRSGQTGFEVEFLTPEDLLVFARAFPGGIRQDSRLLSYDKKYGENMKDMLRFLADKELSVSRLERKERSLEDLFMEVMGK